LGRNIGEITQSVEGSFGSDMIPLADVQVYVSGSSWGSVTVLETDIFSPGVTWVTLKLIDCITGRSPSSVDFLLQPERTNERTSSQKSIFGNFIDKCLKNISLYCIDCTTIFYTSPRLF
jgi:hypothetical protein